MVQFNLRIVKSSVSRMLEEEITRKVLREKTYGKRRTSRARPRWANGVAADAQTMLGVRDWQMAARDRVGWRSVLKEVMIPQGL